MFRVKFFSFLLTALFFSTNLFSQISHADSVYLNSICKENMYISYWNYPGIWYHHPEISSVQNFYDQVDSSYVFYNDEFADCYRKLETDSALIGDSIINQTIDNFEITHNYMLFGNKNPFVKLKFNLNNKTAWSYALIDSSSKPVYNNDYAFVIVSGTGTNQIKTILDGNGYHDLNCYVRNLLKPKGDIYIMSMPNEDHRALFFNKKKVTSLPTLQPPYLISYLNAANKSIGLNRLIETVAFIKYLKTKYKKVIVLGLSTGGKAALWASLLAEPDVALIASGYSILVDNDYNSQLINSMSYGNYLLVYDKDSTKARLSQLHTQFLFTQAQNDGALTQYDIDSSITKNFLMPAGNISFFSNYVNHSFPPCPVIDSFLGRCFSMPKVTFSTDKTLCKKDSLQVKLHFNGTPPFTFQLYKNGIPFSNHVAVDTLHSITLFDEGNYLVKNLVDGLSVPGYVSDTLTYEKDLQPFASVYKEAFNCDSNKTKVLLDFGGESPFMLHFTRNNIADSLLLTQWHDSVWLSGGNYVFQSVKDFRNCINPVQATLGLYNNDLHTSITGAQYNCLTNDNTVTLQSSGLLPLTLTYYDSSLASFRYEIFNTLNSTLLLDSGAYKLISVSDSNNCVKQIDSSFQIISQPIAFATDTLQYHCGDQFAVLPLHLQGKNNWVIQTRHNGLLSNLIKSQQHDTIHLLPGLTSIVKITDGHNCVWQTSDSIRINNYQNLQNAVLADSFDCLQKQLPIQINGTGNYPLHVFGKNAGMPYDEWIYVSPHTQYAGVGIFTIDSIVDRTLCKQENVYSQLIQNDTIDSDGIVLDHFRLKTSNTSFEKYFWYLNGQLIQETTLPYLDINKMGSYAVGYFNQHQCFLKSKELMVDFGKISIYPNPFSEQISIFIKLEINETVQYTLTDPGGRKFGEGKLNEGLNTLHFPHLPKGVYLLSFLSNVTDLQYPTQRLIKN